MDKFKQILQTNLGQFVIHLIFVMLFFVFTIYNYQFYSIQKSFIAKTEQKNEIDKVQSNLQNQNVYINSPLYPEKYAKKELNHKLVGEEVIEILEPIDNQDKPNYIPPTTRIKRENIQKWFICLIGSNKTVAQSKDEQENYIRSSCKQAY